MNTFLPDPDPTATARVLDRQRLGKQRIETKQILAALRGETRGWRNHPAVRMWRGHEGALAAYGVAICREWIARGYQDNQLSHFVSLAEGDLTPPRWMGDPAFHLSHQSNLVRKAPEHYRVWYPHVPDDLPYVWPV